jgi:hypothetical protein
VTFDAAATLTGFPVPCVLVLVSQWFAPTKFVITVEGSEDQFGIFERDAKGNVTSLRLPGKLVVMANHQVRAAGNPHMFYDLFSLGLH